MPFFIVCDLTSTQSDKVKVCVLLRVQLLNHSTPWSVSPAGLLTALSAEESIRRGGRTTAWFGSGLVDSSGSRHRSRERRAASPHAVWHHAALHFYHPSSLQNSHKNWVFSTEDSNHPTIYTAHVLTYHIEFIISVILNIYLLWETLFVGMSFTPCCSRYCCRGVMIGCSLQKYLCFFSGGWTWVRNYVCTVGPMPCSNWNLLFFAVVIVVTPVLLPAI